MSVEWIDSKVIIPSTIKKENTPVKKVPSIPCFIELFNENMRHKDKLQELTDCIKNTYKDVVTLSKDE